MTMVPWLLIEPVIRNVKACTALVAIAIESGRREVCIFTDSPGIAVDHIKGDPNPVAEPIHGFTPEDWWRGQNLLRFAWRKKQAILANTPLAPNVSNAPAVEPLWLKPGERGLDPERPAQGTS